MPIQKSYSTIGIRRIKGGTWRAGTSPRPYAGDATSHTAEFLRHAHYTGNLPFLQGGKSRCGSVCCIGAVQGSLYPAQPFYSPQPELPAGDGTVPPGDPFGDPAAAWRKNPSCRQRTARGRSGLPDQMSGGFFSAVLPEKISKNIKPAASLLALNTRDPEKTKRRDEHETKTAGTDFGHGPGPDRLRGRGCRQPGRRRGGTAGRRPDRGARSPDGQLHRGGEPALQRGHGLGGLPGRGRHHLHRRHGQGGQGALLHPGRGRRNHPL